ncbi:hypothetical protein MUG87_02370 [Ectobacillus sp. JY-23]|uniref:hypothetical protein n=1 Tax=Ectobacillus sp. JY-23 TaxID=2933872 RepID=UPI001FF45456|nr:hypothetical protein [Ectobacillus sp. JY-23]UOY93003.1 hypothetical protein MUG87_02370 [Ectobacillus sp. JY-23]
MDKLQALFEYLSAQGISVQEASDLLREEILQPSVQEQLDLGAWLSHSNEDWL